MKNNDCYYIEFDTCTNPSSKHCDKYCTGAEKCENYISGDDYFSSMMNGGPEPSNAGDEGVKERQARIRKNLSLGKTKKQQKYDRKQEEAQLGDGTGYSMKDDPRFKDFFK